MDREFQRFLRNLNDSQNEEEEHEDEESDGDGDDDSHDGGEAQIAYGSCSASINIGNRIPQKTTRGSNSQRIRSLVDIPSESTRLKEGPSKLTNNRKKEKLQEGN